MEKRGKNLVSLTGEECYKFRCAMLHQGKAVHNHAKFYNIVYMKNGISHNNVSTSRDGRSNLYIDIPTFCRDIISSGADWFNARSKNKIVQKYLNQMIQGRPAAQTDFGRGPYVA